MNSSLVYLTQTDTTVGFLSQDDKKLSSVKQRDTKQKILQVVDSYRTLTKFVRVPQKYRKKIRRAKVATIIYPNKCAYRVVDRDSKHQNFLQKFQVIYSTSANKTKNSFDLKYALEKSDLIVYTPNQFQESQSSHIYLLNAIKIRKIR